MIAVIWIVMGILLCWWCNWFKDVDDDPVECGMITILMAPFIAIIWLYILITYPLKRQK